VSPPIPTPIFVKTMAAQAPQALQAMQAPMLNLASPVAVSTDVTNPSHEQQSQQNDLSDLNLSAVVDSSSETDSLTDQATIDNTLEPIAFVTTTTPTGILTCHTGKGCTLIKHSEGARITERQPGVLTLYKGEVLISACEHVSVDVGGHRIEVLPGAI